MNTPTGVKAYSLRRRRLPKLSRKLSDVVEKIEYEARVTNDRMAELSAGAGGLASPLRERTLAIVETLSETNSMLQRILRDLKSVTEL